VPRGLDITACAAEDRRALTVFAVNIRTEPVAVRLDLGALPTGVKIAGGEVVGDTQDRRQIDITNGWDHPERVKTMPLSFQGETFTLPALSVAAVDIR
jgi:alpha-L-arabinofuranosidase